VAFLQRENGEFVGMVDAVDVNAAVQEGVDGTTAAETLVRRQLRPLTPADPLSAALRIFESDDSQVAAVVARRDAPRLIGCVQEADLLRLYLEEADRMRREELGAVGLFTSATTNAKPDGGPQR
jgi:CBS domain-containing protein